jgi:hypothetical protein
VSFTIFLLCIWFLESSCGKNLDHPDGSHGHTGINDITLRDINQRSLSKFRRQFKIEDLEKKELAFEASRFHIQDYENYSKLYDWDLEDWFLFWRAGAEGMKHPSEEMKAYARHGVSCYSQLMQGVPYWKLK